MGGEKPEAALGELEGLRALARSLVHSDAEAAAGATANDRLQDTAIAALQHLPASKDEQPVRV